MWYSNFPEPSELLALDLEESGAHLGVHSATFDVHYTGRAVHAGFEAAACAVPDAERAMLDGVLALAAIAIEAATTPDTPERLLSRRGRGQP